MWRRKGAIQPQYCGAQNPFSTDGRIRALTHVPSAHGALLLGWEEGYPSSLETIGKAMTGARRDREHFAVG